MKTLLYLLYWPANTVWWCLQSMSPFRIKAYGFLFVSNKGSIVLGKNIVVNAHRFANIIGGDTHSNFMVGRNAMLSLGDRVAISNSTICCRESVIIEHDVMIGGGCKIWDTDFHPISINDRKADPNSNYKNKPVHIKAHAFIGANSIIMKGVTIGENSVIGAGSVVRTSVPPNEIWAGNPAVFVKKLEQ